MRINYEGLEQSYRETYWQINELQLILSDAPDPEYVMQELEKLHARQRTCENLLGYVPAT